MKYTLRPYKPDDRAALDSCDFTFTTKSVLSLNKTGRGLAVGWQLTERELDGQYMGDYALADADWELILQRGKDGDALLWVAETAGQPVALLDAGSEAWNETAKIWNLYVDAAHRGQHVGKKLIEHAAEWARAPERKVRALVVETQTNNLPACKFYQACGFQLCGIDDHFYSNDDPNAKMGVGEMALFWYLAL